jgi:multidrug efflux system outer membrane protein
MKDKRLKIKDEGPRAKEPSRRGSFPLSSFLFPLIALALSGCMVGPDYEKPEVDTPAEWRYQVTDAADTVNTAWWQQFDDPVLDQLVEDALDNNKDVRIAAARVEEFAARVDITRSGLFPQFGYGGSADRSKTSLDTVAGVPAGISRTNDLYNASLNVGWELDLWGKIRRATEAARANLLAQ